MNQNFDPTIQTEDIAFKPDELIACPGCGRSNPPTRANCLYCARDLGVNLAPEQMKGWLRPLESWEQGWNLIALEGKGSHEAAALLGIDRELLTRLLESGEQLPIARVESSSIANAAGVKLKELGITTRTISDQELEPARSPIRLRSIGITDIGLLLTDFNTGAAATLEWADLAALVEGRIVTGRTDTVEKKRRRNKDAKIIDSSEATYDERVVDLYRRSDPTGYRINEAGFDFSCLGQSKGLLAGENLDRLIGRITELAPNARHNDSYHRIGQLLADVWPVESRRDTKGLMASGFGRREFGTTASTSNLSQFNRYSRLQWHLL